MNQYGDSQLNPFETTQSTDNQTLSTNSSYIQITEAELFDSFLEWLSNQTAWKNIYQISYALDVIEKYYKLIFPFIIAKNKEMIIVKAIAKNNEIAPKMKENIITYLEQNGIKYNKFETLFENISHMYDDQFELYTNLGMLIINKRVDPNFQTDVGTIFHIFAKLGIETRDASVTKDFQLLVDNGCDIDALNKDGKTAVELAVDTKHLNTASFLKELYFYKKQDPVAAHLTLPEKIVNGKLISMSRSSITGKYISGIECGIYVSLGAMFAMVYIRSFLKSR
uniref:Uncharacterized protein n=1 Tax=viral metagenome TaxID=1070528 RepID=A0A6C0C6R1_9ZZZZ